MPKIRHIAYRANDVEGMANFFTSALSMTVVQRRKNGAIDLSDGTMNITLLPSAGRRSGRRPAKTGNRPYWLYGRERGGNFSANGISRRQKTRSRRLQPNRKLRD